MSMNRCFRFWVATVAGAVLWGGAFVSAAPYPYPPNPTLGGLPATIDVLVLYTQTAERNLELANPLQNPGDPHRAIAEIGEAITYLNTSLTNSGVQASVNLLEARCICTTDSAALPDPPCGPCDPAATLTIGASDAETLANLTSPSPSVQAIHGWRDQLGADIVMLVSHGGSVTGISGWPHQYSTAYDSDAFGIVFVGNSMTPDDDRTFAHELGHLLGGQHDWYHTDTRLALFDVGDDEFSPSVFHAHGHVDVDETATPVSGFYTIMSYPTLCDAEGASCRAIPYFSNPDVNDTVTGRPTGVAAHPPDANYYSICLADPPSLATDDGNCPADVADVFDAMVPYVAAYRGVGGPDGSASDVSIVQTTPRTLTVTWTDGASNESGFRIFRSRDSGLNWTYIAFVGVDATRFVDTVTSAYKVTPPWNQWRYRVEAYNPHGMSTYSEGGIILDTGCTTVDVDFEDTPDLGLPPWDNDPSFPFAVVAQPDGNRMMQSFAPDGSSSGSPQVTLSRAVGDGFVCFDLNTTSLLQFTVDGVPSPNAAWSYETVTARFAVPVSAGTHRFGWQLIFYDFDVGAPSFVDNVSFPGPKAAALPSVLLLLGGSNP